MAELEVLKKLEDDRNVLLVYMLCELLLQCLLSDLSRAKGCNLSNRKAVWSKSLSQYILAQPARVNEHIIG